MLGATACTSGLSPYRIRSCRAHIKVLRSNLSQLKLPSINPQQDDELKSLVLAAEANSTEEIKEEINRAIFKLYGLDDEEIAVIRKRLEA